jgi:hypothetical protein
MAIEIVSFLINSMVIFHSYVNVYQRVHPAKPVRLIFFGLMAMFVEIERDVEGITGTCLNSALDPVKRHVVSTI